jgi:hypothetical protein
VAESRAGEAGAEAISFRYIREADARARANHVKRLEISLEQTESKIAEFYGPLHGLIRQIWATWEVKERMKKGLDQNIYIRRSINTWVSDTFTCYTRGNGRDAV